MCNSSSLCNSFLHPLLLMIAADEPHTAHTQAHAYSHTRLESGSKRCQISIEEWILHDVSPSHQALNVPRFPCWSVQLPPRWYTCFITLPLRVPTEWGRISFIFLAFWFAFPVHRSCIRYPWRRSFVPSLVSNGIFFGEQARRSLWKTLNCSSNHQPPTAAWPYERPSGWGRFFSASQVTSQGNNT